MPLYFITMRAILLIYNQSLSKLNQAHKNKIIFRIKYNLKIINNNINNNIFSINSFIMWQKQIIVYIHIIYKYTIMKMIQNKCKQLKMN